MSSSKDFKSSTSKSKSKYSSGQKASIFSLLFLSALILPLSIWSTRNKNTDTRSQASHMATPITPPISPPVNNEVYWDVDDIVLKSSNFYYIDGNNRLVTANTGEYNFGYWIDPNSDNAITLNLSWPEYEAQYNIQLHLEKNADRWWVSHIYAGGGSPYVNHTYPTTTDLLQAPLGSPIIIPSLHLQQQNPNTSSGSDLHFDSFYLKAFTSNAQFSPDLDKDGDVDYLDSSLASKKGLSIFNFSKIVKSFTNMLLPTPTFPPTTYYPTPTPRISPPIEQTIHTNVKSTNSITPNASGYIKTTILDRYQDRITFTAAGQIYNLGPNRTYFIAYCDDGILCSTSSRFSAISDSKGTVTFNPQKTSLSNVYRITRVIIIERDDILHPIPSQEAADQAFLIKPPDNPGLTVAHPNPTWINRPTPTPSPAPLYNHCYTLNRPCVEGNITLHQNPPTPTISYKPQPTSTPRAPSPSPISHTYKFTTHIRSNNTITPLAKGTVWTNIANGNSQYDYYVTTQGSVSGLVPNSSYALVYCTKTACHHSNRSLARSDQYGMAFFGPGTPRHFATDGFLTQVIILEIPDIPHPNGCYSEDKPCAIGTNNFIFPSPTPSRHLDSIQ